MNTTAPGSGGSNGELAGQHILYRHWSKDGKLLYAGRTNNPPARFSQHRKASDWWSLVSWTTYEKFPSLEALKAGESWAIEHEHPEHNIQGRRYPGAARKDLEPGYDRYIPVKTSDLRLTVHLTHPLSREFSVYGGNDAVLRAREWALANRYYLLNSGNAKCAHALYLMDCPQFGKCLPHADHTQVWVPAPDFSDFERRSCAENPFILTQPYQSTVEENTDDETPADWRAVPPLLGIHGQDSKIPAEVTAYAAAHGLDAESFTFDAWYYPGRCMPIRLTPASSANVPFPLASEALSLMCLWRDNWPDTIPEWLK